MRPIITGMLCLGLTLTLGLTTYSQQAQAGPRSAASGQDTWLAFDTCQTGLKQVGDALQSYGFDHRGRFPTKLSQLVPRYLPRIPSCPSAGHDTYSVSYTSSTNPNSFAVFCKGSHHSVAGINPNFPEYTSARGIFWRVAAGRPRNPDAMACVACKSNLRNIGTAAEMYSTDHGGGFPTQLSQLTPKYLRAIPTCPSVGADTYSASYTSSHNPHSFGVFCRGSNHGKIGLKANFPKYTSTEGLLMR